jgi:hypothetical protein
MGVLVSFFKDSDETNKEKLFNLIERQRETFNRIKINELPLTKDNITHFTYRCTDVYRSITKKQLKDAKMIDFQKQLLKSPKMKEYFTSHQQERDILVDKMQGVSAKLHKFATNLRDELPDYLASKYGLSRDDETTKDQNARRGIVKVLLRKRKERPQSEAKTEENGVKAEEDGGENNQRRKKRQGDGDQFMYINENAEDPSIMHPDYLKPLSGRKLWKMRHGKLLKRSNKRLMKKGIFIP